jgi:hypothetical protein
MQAACPPQLLLYEIIPQNIVLFTSHLNLGLEGKAPFIVGSDQLNAQAALRSKEYPSVPNECRAPEPQLLSPISMLRFTYSQSGIDKNPHHAQDSDQEIITVPP